MALIKNQYDDHITSKSKLELIKFAKWLKKNQGNWPTVIGGWAVWSYYPQGFGSRDVDLVLPSDSWIETVMINDYFPNNGFLPYDYLNQNWIEQHYGKLVDPTKPHDDKIFFDLLSASRPRDDPEKIGVYVDWNWANKFGNEINISSNAHIIVPEIELLVTLKMIGALARSKALLLVRERTYLTGKIWKDYIDIANLASKMSIDRQKLKKHFTNSKLTKLLWQEFLDGYIRLPDVLVETKTNIPIIEKALKVDWKK